MNFGRCGDTGICARRKNLLFRLCKRIKRIVGELFEPDGVRKVYVSKPVALERVQVEGAEVTEFLVLVVYAASI